MPNVIEAKIQDRITSFVQELDILVRKSALEALNEALGNDSGAPARRGRPARIVSGTVRPRGSGSANVEEASAKIVAHVRSNDGQGISAIASATGIALPVAKKAASRLLADGTLKKSGQKRGTVYHIGSGRAPTAMKARGRK